jgi:hypothetical protein
MAFMIHLLTRSGGIYSAATNVLENGSRGDRPIRRDHSL